MAVLTAIAVPDSACATPLPYGRMATEIERKFLVRDRTFLSGSTGIPYRQGYLSTDPDRTVRVRRAGKHSYLTIKGRSEGPVRSEFEYEIPTADAEQLLELCQGRIIEKDRHRIEHAGRTWEVDVFAGDNAGLVIAEVEVPAADAPLEIPAWAGEEVTADARYFNASLVHRPFRS